MTNERKTPRPPAVDVPALERASVRHQQRYAATSEQLRRVLKRRLRRAVMRSEPDDRPDVERVQADIEVVLARMQTAGLLDDRKLAFSLAAELLRKGSSLPLIRMKLRQKGVDGPLLDEAVTHVLSAAREAGIDPELAAATAYARRRRLGPFRRSADERGERRQKDLAALARRGFGYGVAKQVIDAEDPDALPDPAW